MRAAAEPLQASCSAEVAAEIEAAVSEAVSAWEDTVASLQGLCDRYQNAVQLWQQYREASDALSAWADGAADAADSMAPQQALAQVKVGVTCYTYTLDTIVKLYKCEVSVGGEDQDPLATPLHHPH